MRYTAANMRPFMKVMIVKVFEHYVPIATLLELLADSVLCFVAVLLAVTLLPVGAGHVVPMSQVMFPAAVFSAVMSLLFSFVGLYRRGAWQRKTAGTSSPAARQLHRAVRSIDGRQDRGSSSHRATRAGT